jgi:hypothetical protein
VTVFCIKNHSLLSGKTSRVFVSGPGAHGEPQKSPLSARSAPGAFRVQKVISFWSTKCRLFVSENSDVLSPRWTVHESPRNIPSLRGTRPGGRVIFPHAKIYSSASATNHTMFSSQRNMVSIPPRMGVFGFKNNCVLDGDNHAARVSRKVAS